MELGNGPFTEMGYILDMSFCSPTLRSRGGEGDGGGGGMPSIFLYMAREWQTEHENLKKLMVVVILFHRCSENLRKEGLVLPLVEVNL